jgi:hypothetical protein
VADAGVARLDLRLGQGGSQVEGPLGLDLDRDTRHAWHVTAILGASARRPLRLRERGSPSQST